ncbi:alpha/beta fold hydrolase [Cytobacillus dafuensis]|uniref:Alpha/beta hydrolase n=1 Tax=Cytobacillus dafuensis TaxID=1742359 RepID=A0A5B8YZ60_CYTDA|nr:alpha/beta hydrolase [Cytobacillus dafuensis]QED45980.1 alpha/beta hydrolase [Cytobacillus dafuensis]
MVKTGRVTSEGDELYFEVRGQGVPLLMISGGGGDAGFYSYVADILADEYQVITYDRRGNSRSTRNEPVNFEVSREARDAVAVLRAAGHETAYVFGNSGGAIFALEMARSHPQAVKAMVVHEPPVLRVLPDRKKWLGFFAKVFRTSFRFNYQIALFRFNMALSIPFSAFKSVPKDFQDRVTKANNNHYLINHEMLSSVNYMPDIKNIKQNGVKVIMAAGSRSLAKGAYYARTAPILAEMLGCKMVTFPGHHISYFDLPHEWAETLRKVLKSTEVS